MKDGTNRKEVTVVQTQDCMMQNISRKKAQIKQTQHNNIPVYLNKSNGLKPDMQSWCKKSTNLNSVFV